MGFGSGAAPRGGEVGRHEKKNSIGLVMIAVRMITMMLKITMMTVVLLIVVLMMMRMMLQVCRMRSNGTNKKVEQSS